MRSPAGFLASAVFLLALPVTAMFDWLVGAGSAAVIHAALALGSCLMARAAFDFGAPRWAAWIGGCATAILATIFLLQGLSEVVESPGLTQLAYQGLGQRLEASLQDAFGCWCVAVLVFDRSLAWRRLGSSAIAAIVAVRVYAVVLASAGSSLDAQAPALKLLWLAPFVWLLLESRRSVAPAPRGANG
jgi:hypothetical protein